MGRLPDDARNEALREIKLARLCVLRAEGIFSEDQIVQKLDFVDETGTPLREAMYERLEAWGLPDWVVYPGDGMERAGKVKTILNPSCPLQTLNGESQEEADDLQLEASGRDRVDLLGEQALNRLKTVSTYWRTGLPKNSSHMGIGRLEFFLRWALRCKPTSSSRSS
jgi:hypothetical protein